MFERLEPKSNMISQLVKHNEREGDNNWNLDSELDSKVDSELDLEKNIHV